MQHAAPDGMQTTKPLSAGNAVGPEHEHSEIVALGALLERHQRAIDVLRDLLRRDAGAVVEQRGEALLTEALGSAARSVRDAFGVENERVAGVQVELVGLPGDLLERAEQGARTARGDDLTARAQEVGR